MTEKEFICELQEMLECEEDLTAETDLTVLDGYDSFFIMALIAFIDKNFKVKCAPEQLREAATPVQLMDVIGKNFFSE